jgi:hypothetical protein
MTRARALFSMDGKFSRAWPAGIECNFDQLKRREFITLLGGAAASTWPVAARAQQGDRMLRVGVLMTYAESDPLAQIWFKAFVEGMQAVGWIDGRNVRLDVRWATIFMQSCRLRSGVHST